MKTNYTCKRLAFVALMLSILNLPLSTAFAQGAAFTYQGRLDDGGNPYTGNAEFQPTLWNAESDGTHVAANTPSTVIVGVTNGLFVLSLDFGSAAFAAGAERWLQLDVRTTIGPFTPLAPRQKLTPAPYALTAGNLTGLLPARQLSGALPSANLEGIYSGLLAFDNARNSFSGSFTGGGGGLTGLNASQLTSGTVPDARLGDNVARFNQVWSVTGNAGTSPATHFVGTTDDVPLVLRAGNRQLLRLESEATGYRIIAGTTNSVSVDSTNSVILGGRRNSIDLNAHESSIVGGLDNVVGRDQRSAFIGGGARNEILLDNQHAVIAGGRDNRVGSNSVISLVVGGGENRIANNVDGGLMVGGFRNDIRGSVNPNRRQIAPVLIGGSDNEIGLNSNWAAILGGDNNVIGTNAVGAAILAGMNNIVADNASNAVALGRTARANHSGAFVWADNQSAAFASERTGQFRVRANGGVRLDVNNGGWIELRHPGNIGISPFKLLNTSSGAYLSVGGTWADNSDRNKKENFAPVDAREILDRVTRLPVSHWNYHAEDKSVRHIGPTAQDFHAAFAVGAGDKHIAALDANGVALAAIQGLNRKLEEQRLELQQKATEITKLKERLEALEQIVAADNHNRGTLP
jgi:hypothetical protein